MGTCERPSPPLRLALTRSSCLGILKRRPGQRQPELGKRPSRVPVAGSLSGDGHWTFEGSATSREDGHAAVSCGRGEGCVERREGGLVVDCHVQYAAVGQFEAGTRP
jgi:hypothetical protein